MITYQCIPFSNNAMQLDNGGVELTTWCAERCKRSPSDVHGADHTRYNRIMQGIMHGFATRQRMPKVKSILCERGSQKVEKRRCRHKERKAGPQMHRAAVWG